ncbi:hypothetical protein PMAYCL1PPCAC_07843 [Pristionchus mayeri]|uniref:Saposin B-type domain-containing protein n=1 Tax=Pristionchus mayeri TaxID=1317129 RepID=A0AAN4ZFP0_9BILA|nr:hypothetical protein PMAYCL1PPCAC_07843 [Pristionchus mayeri]
MRLLALCLASLLIATPVNAQAEGIFGFVEDVFQFLCNRCKDFITTLDNVIENQPFKKELDGVCRNFIPEPTIQAICINLVDTILGGVYDQLKKLEPRPEVCTSLRLCLECGVPQTFNIPTSPPFPPKPTLPNDLFSQFDLNKINNPDSSSFRRRRSVDGEEKEEEKKEGEKEVKEGEKESEDGVQVEPVSTSGLRNKNDSDPFDPIQFYGKVAELASTVARLRRMAADKQPVVDEGL